MPRLIDVCDVTRPMPLLSDARPELGALGAVVDRCLQKDAEHRISDASELLQALEGAARAAGERRATASKESGESEGLNEQAPTSGEPDDAGKSLNAGESAETGQPAVSPEPSTNARTSTRTRKMVLGGLAVLAVAIAGALFIGTRKSSNESAPVASDTERTPESRTSVANKDAKPSAQALVAMVSVEAEVPGESPARALFQHLQAYPHGAGLLPATQDTRDLFWLRTVSPMTLAEAKRSSAESATPIVVAARADGRAEISVRGPQGTWLIERLELFAGSDAARAELAPLLYSLARVQRGEMTSADCVSLPPAINHTDPLAVLRLYVNRQQPRCRDQVPDIAPSSLLAVCNEAGNPDICNLARGLYTELFPDADDVVSVLRTLLDEQPAYVSMSGAALARTSCRRDRLPAAHAVLADLVTRLGQGPERACERLALIDVAECIATHPRATEQLRDPAHWRAAIDSLERALASDCAACDIPSYCGDKLGQRGLIRSRRGLWDLAATDFAEAFARSHNSDWALLRAEASLHLGQLEDARRRLRQLADDRVLTSPAAHLQHALFSWLAARGAGAARRPAPGPASNTYAQRLVDVYEYCCTDTTCHLDPEDAPLRALTCPSPGPCIYDVLAGPRTRASVTTLRTHLGLAATSTSPSDEERAALRRTCPATDR